MGRKAGERSGVAESKYVRTEKLGSSSLRMNKPGQ